MIVQEALPAIYLTFCLRQLYAAKRGNKCKLQLSAPLKWAA